MLQRWRNYLTPAPRGSTEPQASVETRAEGARHALSPDWMDGDGAATLARWLANTERVQRAEAERQAWAVWRIYDSPAYAAMWYDARDAGERVRARMLTQLNANQRIPGGRHPDPREPGSFSGRTIIGAAARDLHLTIWPYVPSQQGPIPTYREEEEGTASGGDSAIDVAIDSADGPEPSAQPAQPLQPLVWLQTFPEPEGQPPVLIVQLATPKIPEPRILFDMACMLGFLYRDRTPLDPDAPHGVTLLPRNPGMQSLLHQFALALLCLEPACPPAWKCHCNVIRARYNAPPPDHEQPTDTLALADLEGATNHQRGE